MRRILITSLLTLVVVFSGCSGTDTEDLQGKFSTKKTEKLVVGQGTYVGRTNTLIYGAEVPIASFFLSSNSGRPISVRTASFVIKESGLYGPAFGEDLSYELYPVVDGVIDTSQEILDQANFSDDGVDGILWLSLRDPVLGSSYSLQVSSPQEYVILAEVIDDGVLNTNEISVETVDKTYNSLSEWAWSNTPKLLMTDSTFIDGLITGGSLSTFK